MEKKFHLANLLTDLGERNLYDALSQCNRCGYCETVCPTYVMTGREPISARGRNQILRMLIEGKIKNAQDSVESLLTCLLCGACTTECYGKVPTADIVLEGRRSLTGHGKNFFASTGIKLLLKKPEIFEMWLKIAYILKKFGFSYLASKIGLYHLLGMPAIAEAQKSVIKTPLKFLNEILQQDNSLKITNLPVKWIYFAPCGPNYLFPEVGIASINILKRFLGHGIFMNGSCCGLLSYNYGNL
ncbi:MAG: (Fe-S)-binding protein, partial [Elusimicrobiota bacterium]